MNIKRTLYLALSYLLLIGIPASGQLGVKYDPSIQSTKNLQYWKPQGNLFVGDAIPFSRNGTYYYYWLLDSAHHASLGGLGGHQWALSTTTDLKTWKHEPIVLGIGEAWEKSICTGSIVFHKDLYYAFYATRLLDANGNINEQLSYAISKDGVHFEKQQPNPFYTSAAGYSKRDFRDPKAFVDEKTGEFHLFVSSWQENPVMRHAGGCLVHMTSVNLKDWTVKEPVLTGQPSVPECADYFEWNGWYYLLYGNNLETSYVKSKNPYGPWEQPKSQALTEWGASVVKTAAFGKNRRIAAAWIPGRGENRDHGGKVFGGNSVFRELIQDTDGTLYTKFPAEMIPESAGSLNLTITADQYSSVTGTSDLSIAAPNGVGAAHIENVPARCRITLEIDPQTAIEEYGFYLRSDGNADKGYRLNFSPANGIVNLAGDEIRAVAGLGRAIKIDLILKDDIIDVCIDGKRCFVNRKPEQKGSFLWFYAKHGTVKFKSIKISPLVN